MKIGGSFESFSVYRLVLLGVSLFVPPSERKEWLTEWTSELWYLMKGSDAGLNAQCRQRVVTFCLGSFPDAYWMRRNKLNHTLDERLWLRLPIGCTILLALLATITSVVAYMEGMLQAPYTGSKFMFLQLLVLGMALLILPTTTHFALGHYPSNLHSSTGPASLNRWLFLSMKIVLLLVIVFCATLDFWPMFGLAGFPPQATLIGYFLALRWALIDQRRRCPVCLQLLTNPVRVGQPSHTMLEWYGIELVCSKGHGLLHVPETRTSSYGAQTWLQLDSSWRSLFPECNTKSAG